MSDKMNLHSRRSVSHTNDWSACIENGQIHAELLEINAKVLKCKQLQDLEAQIKALTTETEELRRLLAETRDHVQVLIDLNRMRGIDANKEQYMASVQSAATRSITPSLDDIIEHSYPICD